MDGHYFLVRSEGNQTVCVYGLDFYEGVRFGSRAFGNGDPVKKCQQIDIKWFHVEPILAEPRKFHGSTAYSLKEQFFSGGKIGCEAQGLTLIFSPELLDEPGERPDGTLILGSAAVEVQDMPHLSHKVELEGLDEGHLIDRLSMVAVLCVGRHLYPETRPSSSIPQP